MTSERTRAKRSRMRGFTLIELGAVVVIVGILAVLAVVGYRKYVDSVRFAEAANLVAATRTGEEIFKAEAGYYADISKTPRTESAYPGVPGKYKTGWGGACPGCKDGVSFETINVRSAGSVAFGYMVVASQPGCDPACRGAVMTHEGTTIDWGPKGKTEAWYIVHAVADFEGGGKAGEIHVLGSSFSNTILMGKE